MAETSKIAVDRVSECHLLQRRFKDYMCAEVAYMVEQIGDVLPDDPAEVNRMVIEWINKNAAQFRAKWVERQMNEYKPN
jgi:hypothetical protein